METVISDIVQSATAQNMSQLRESHSIRQEQAAKTTAFHLEMTKLQQDRSSLNDVRKHINDVVTDAMTILKKSGDEVRQSSK